MSSVVCWWEYWLVVGARQVRSGCCCLTVLKSESCRDRSSSGAAQRSTGSAGPGHGHTSTMETHHWPLWRHHQLHRHHHLHPVPHSGARSAVTTRQPPAEMLLMLLPWIWISQLLWGWRCLVNPNTEKIYCPSWWHHSSSAPQTHVTTSNFTYSLLDTQISHNSDSEVVF